MGQSNGAPLEEVSCIYSQTSLTETQGTVLKIHLNFILCKQHYILCLYLHSDLGSISC